MGSRAVPLLLPLLLLALAAGRAPAAGPGSAAATRRVCVRGVCFTAELAVTASERARGLMFRDALPDDRAMLFVFPEPGRHGFWMKNTRIELDIVFIGAGRRIVSVAHRATPCRTEPCAHYLPEGDAAYVLEVAGGLAERHGFAAGDPVEFR